MYSGVDTAQGQRGTPSPPNTTSLIKPFNLIGRCGRRDTCHHKVGMLIGADPVTRCTRGEHDEGRHAPEPTVALGSDFRPWPEPSAGGTVAVEAPPGGGRMQLGRVTRVARFGLPLLVGLLGACGGGSATVVRPPASTAPSLTMPTTTTAAPP